MTVQLLQGNCLDTLKTLEPNSVQCVVTSPPYYGLRDYGTAEWNGGKVDCEHVTGNQVQDNKAPGAIVSGVRPGSNNRVCKLCGAIRVDNQIGLEETPEAYVEKLVQVFRECRRVLKDDGTCWINLGDSYAANRGYQVPDTHIVGQARDAGGRSMKAKDYGLKPKDLIGIPWMVAFALRADGWYLRSEIIWHKPNPMPESVKDRPTKAHEQIFLLSKSAQYFYDADAIMEDGVSYRPDMATKGIRTGKAYLQQEKVANNSKYSFARTVNEEPPHGKSNQHRPDREDVEYSGKRNKRDVWTVTTKPYKGAHFATFPPDLIEPCILAGSREGDVVLDPFNGSGTTGAVSVKHRRNYIGCELNPEYIELTRKRLAKVQIEAPL